MSSYHSIVRAAYDVDRDSDSWVQGICRAAHHCFGSDVGAYVVHGDYRAVHNFNAVGETFEAWAAAAARMQDGLRADVLRNLYRGGPFVELWSQRSRHLRTGTVPPEAVDYLEAADRMQLAMGAETVGIFGGSASGGLMLCARQGKPTIAARTLWALRQVAVHLDAAYRLHRSRDIEPDAILDETGELLEGRGELPTEAIEDAVRERNTSARLAESEPENALSVWRGLIAGRWSLVQAREQGRRRVLLLRRNEIPEAEGDGLAARRVSSVAALAARGHSNKMIAYELGLPLSTVASDLRTVLERLGLSRRTDLVRLSAQVSRE